MTYKKHFVQKILCSLIVIYLISIIVVGSYFMTSDCSSVNNSNDKLSQAKNEYEESLKSYNLEINELQTVNNLISDAKCVNSGLSKFINETIKYASLNDYGINLQVINNPTPISKNNIIYDYIQQYETRCKILEDYTKPFCNSNCFQWTCQRFCDDEDCASSKCDKTLVSRSCTYYRTTLIQDHYGIFVKGNSKISLDCGQFTHSMEFKSSEFLITSTKTIKNSINGRIVDEQIDNFYGSKIIYEQRNPDFKTVEKIIPTTTFDLNSLINEKTSFIKTQISMFSIKETDYEEIISSNLLKIPKIEETIKEKKEIMNSKKENMDSQKNVNDNVNTICNKSYSLWLPLILVVPLVLSCFVLILPEESNENQEKENQKENEENEKRINYV